MTPEAMRLLFDFDAWANHRCLQSVLLLSDKQFTQPLGSSFTSVRDTLGHVCGAEWLWLERFEGRSPAALPDDKEFGTASALSKHWQAQEGALLKFVAHLTQQDLDHEIEYRTMKHGAYRNPLWQSMQHLVNHGTYHRGQVATMLRQLGTQAMQTDLMHFYRERSAGAAA
jgi:uncharacterized damage-inducible protein DinB